MFALYLSHPKEPWESVVLPFLNQLPLPIIIYPQKESGGVSLHTPSALWGAVCVKIQGNMKLIN